MIHIFNRKALITTLSDRELFRIVGIAQDGWQVPGTSIIGVACYVPHILGCPHAGDRIHQHNGEDHKNGDGQ